MQSRDKAGLKILVIEDNKDIAQNIAEHFEVAGHQMDFATNGKLGLELALENYFDLVILDLTLPNMDGLEVCTQLRQKSERHVPILMLTARDSLDDKVKGFDLGADDYLTKPFALAELEVRSQALSRRHQLQTNHLITIGSLCIDRQQQKVTRQNQQIMLKPIPFKILQVLAESYPRVVSKSELCQKLWGDDPTESDSLRSHIYQLRQSLDKPFEHPVLKTIHGVGLALEKDTA